MKHTRVIVLGATGSIGRQTLECLHEAESSDPGRFSVVGLSAHSSRESLLAAARRWPEAACALSAGGDSHGTESVAGSRLLSGSGSVERLVRETDADLVVNGIAGAAGLAASVAALESGKNLALANKESVVMAWDMLTDRAGAAGASIIPVDSEHAALFQLMRRVGSGSVVEATITASGGAFRDRPIETLGDATPDEAAAHPTWKMGRKISIDSATMANKGLELIEAARLFDLQPDRVRVLIHPESLVHAMVRTKDGALYAHVSEADMRLPIHVALYWPDETRCPFGALDPAGKTLRFMDPDPRRYPMLALARRAVLEGSGATIAYNAANEAAVAAFEARRIRYDGIPRVTSMVLDTGWISPGADLGAILDTDRRARDLANTAITEIG